jgi:BirA family biotin operon repressor/biotin-[acetyl-CoA-carboxylase] ligase
MPVNVERLRERLPDREIFWYQVVSSTMDEAALLALEDLPSGTIVGADEQFRGQGRLGRDWHSPAGEGLYLTFILRPNLKASDTPLVTLALGLATADALAREVDLTCDIRWPNDILVGEKKLAGILVRYDHGAVLAGIGVNVGQTKFPQDMRTPPTSIILESSKHLPLEDLAVALAECTNSYVGMLQRGGKQHLLEAYQRHSSYVHGKQVRVEAGNEFVDGVTDGLSDDGYLYVRTNSGERKLIVAGGLRPVNKAG